MLAGMIVQTSSHAHTNIMTIASNNTISFNRSKDASTLVDYSSRQIYKTFLSNKYNRKHYDNEIANTLQVSTLTQETGKCV